MHFPNNLWKGATMLAIYCPYLVWIHQIWEEWKMYLKLVQIIQKVEKNRGIGDKICMPRRGVET